MKIRGVERGFLMTVGGSMEIASMCPDEDLAKVEQLFNTGSTVSILKATIAICTILVNGHEDNRALEDPQYTPDHVTREDISALPVQDLVAIKDEMLAAIGLSAQTSIETEGAKIPGKKNGGRGAG